LTATCHPPFSLIPLAFPEMTSVAVAFTSRIAGAVLMRFTPDDDFYDDDDIADLPDCAVALLARAGSWSARKSKNGSVSASMLAQLSSDPAQAAEELCKRGIWRRGKRGGYQFTDWERWAEAAEDVKQREAAAERKRELGRERAQRKRDRDKAAKAEVMAEGVTRYVTRYDDAAEENPQARGGDAADGITRPSRSPMRDVTRPEGTRGKKPQVNDGHVTRYEAGSSRVTAKTGASDDQDKDPDQNQSSGVNQSNGRAREALSPGTVAAVAADCSKLLGRPVTEAEASRAIGEWDRRREASGKAVHDPAKFYPACARREHKLRKLEAILAAPESDAARRWRELGQAPEPPPGSHAFVPSRIAFDDSCMHPGCGVPEKNRVHLREANTG
jgi:hypothetical protein